MKGGRNMNMQHAETAPRHALQPGGSLHTDARTPVEPHAGGGQIDVEGIAVSCVHGEL